ncbi:hypothetical protein HanIR_Chr04g0185971 [Helianthus annuus]|nr:hypothetical protein HanIR_Chr04g0185971 [Helianthus annuus]
MSVVFTILAPPYFYMLNLLLSFVVFLGPSCIAYKLLFLLLLLLMYYTLTIFHFSR